MISAATASLGLAALLAACILLSHYNNNVPDEKMSGAAEWRQAGHADLSVFPAPEVEKARRWPKVELHLHLDGSLSPEFVAERAAARNVSLPAPPPALRQWLMQRKLEQLRGGNKAQPGGNWGVFDWCNQFLQTGPELTAATADLLARLAAENVVYAEIRFCPALHTQEGLREEEAVEAVWAGFRGQTAVAGGPVLVALRSLTPAHGLNTAHLAAATAALGFDVAGDEGSFPLAGPQHSMAAAVEEAVQLGLPVTLHAGEWPERFGSLDNLRWAVEKEGVRRVGHGIAFRSDPTLATTIKQRNITLEVCLTSNIGNGFKVASYAVHPVRQLEEAGVAYSLSSDNLLLSGDPGHAPGPTAELLHLVHSVGLGWAAARRSVLAGLRAAFSNTVDQVFIENVEKQLV